MDDLVSAYSTKLKELEESQSGSADSVLAVLLERETISRTLATAVAIEPISLCNLHACDQRLKDWAESMPLEIRTQFAEWRTTLARDDLAWWWSLDEAPEGTNKLSRLGHVLTWIVVAIAISVLVEYARRLSSIGPSVSATVIQGLLGLAGASAIFGFAKDRMAGSAAERSGWRVDVGLATLLSTLAIAASVISPLVAAHWARTGAAEHAEHKLREARTHLERAVRLEPEDWLPHYDFGSVLEDLRDESAAEAEYREALRWNSENPLPYIRMSRLSIVLRKNYVMALELVEEGWDRLNRRVKAGKVSPQEESRYRYDLRECRAWANMGLFSYKPARDELDQAIRESPDRAAAYCLRAVLSIGESKDWSTCHADSLACIGKSQDQKDEIQADWFSLAQSCVSHPETKTPEAATQSPKRK